MSERTRVKAQLTGEESFFAQQAQEQIRELRKKSEDEGDRKYREEHQYHCFRCGTRSLVEIQKGNVAVDICVNENCGAVHLDPGELDSLLADRDFVKNARKKIFDIFK